MNKNGIRNIKIQISMIPWNLCRLKKISFNPNSDTLKSIDYELMRITKGECKESGIVSCWWPVGSHLSGWFWLFAPKLWEVMGTYEWHFIILWMQVQWWGHSNLTLCKRICLNILHSQAVGWKHFGLRTHTISHSRAWVLAPGLPGGISTN